MTINFPELRGHLPSYNTLLKYKNLEDMHLRFFKQQSRREFYYWKCAGLFLLAVLISFILQNRELISNFLVGIMVAGMGFLLLSLRNLIIDVECGIFPAAFVEKGASLEKQSEMPARLIALISLIGMSVGAWSYIKIVRMVVLEGCNESLGVGKGQLFLVGRNIFKMNQ